MVEESSLPDITVCEEETMEDEIQVEGQGVSDLRPHESGPCSCGNAKCGQICAKLSQIPAFAHLTQMVRIKQSTNLGKACKMAKLKGLGTQTYCWIALWHHPKGCRDPVTHRPMVTCLKNPEKGRNTNFSITKFKGVRKRSPNDLFISAPTVTPVDMEKEALDYQKIHSKNTQQQNTEALIKQVPSAVKIDMKMKTSQAYRAGSERSNARLLEENEKLKAELRTVQAALEYTKKELDNQSAQSCLNIDNIGSYSYWSSLPKSVVPSFFQQQDARRLFDFVQSVLWIFGSEEVFTDVFPVPLRPDDVVPMEIKEIAIELATKLTPSEMPTGFKQQTAMPSPMFRVL
jgi:hypothetical protein